MKICLLRKVYLTPKQIALLKGVKENGFSYMFRCDKQSTKHFGEVVSYKKFSAW